MCPKKNFLVIGGGVGPAAGVMFHEKIVNMVDNRGMADQGHAPVIHLSMSPYVLDRTKFLLSNPDQSIPNPGINMGLAVNYACRAFDGAAHNFIVGVPCNTFHSGKVFESYRARLSNPRIQIVNMIEETALLLATRSEKNIILLSTRGTRDTGVYSDYIEKIPSKNLLECDGGKNKGDRSYDKTQKHFFTPDDKVDDEVVAENQQGAVMAAIYDPEFGVKGGTPNLIRAKALFETVTRQLSQDKDPKTVCVIMGCTEIPIAYQDSCNENVFLRDIGKYVDPMDLLAKSMIKRGGYALKSEEAPAVDQEEISGINKGIAEEFTRDMSLGARW